MIYHYYIKISRYYKKKNIYMASIKLFHSDNNVRYWTILINRWNEFIEFNIYESKTHIKYIVYQKNSYKINGYYNTLKYINF